ncbi:unnamed protein product [Pedinophyceae sp. YPF-701]|nr:unnamed protein product [Pedinophyceae sp. YPF-701]
MSPTVAAPSRARGPRSRHHRAPARPASLCHYDEWALESGARRRDPPGPSPPRATPAPLPPRTAPPEPDPMRPRAREPVLARGNELDARFAMYRATNRAPSAAFRSRRHLTPRIQAAHVSTTSRTACTVARAFQGPPPGSSAPATSAAKPGTAAPPGDLSARGMPLWQDLLSTGDLGDMIPRAKSASDVGMLKRKGRLKEQDALIEFIVGMAATHTPAEAMLKIERWIDAHRANPRGSRLQRAVPLVGAFHTRLPLVDALEEYDEFFNLSRRKYVAPNFAEIRHILNIAQVHAIAPSLRLATFDADGTIYQDGHHIEQDSVMIRHLTELLLSDVHVAIVTAAGYPGEAHKFEERVAGLLAAFKSMDLPPEALARFHIMGGECNYLLRCTPDCRLEFVPDAEWKSADMQQWSEDGIRETLDAAQALLLETAARLRTPVQLIRKERAVGVVPSEPAVYEVLEEMAITLQNQLVAADGVPFCAFNGGNDVFCDIGDKSYGLRALMGYLGFGPGQVMHVGDRFTTSGNDASTRELCSILWVAAPEETAFFLSLLIEDIEREMYARQTAAKWKKAPVGDPR